MLNKYQITKLWSLAHNQWIHDENDDRKKNDVIVDFTIDTVSSETSNLRTALNDTNQLLSVLLSDPLVQKDQKDFIRKRLETNKAIISMEGEKTHA